MMGQATLNLAYVTFQCFNNSRSKVYPNSITMGRLDHQRL